MALAITLFAASYANASTFLPIEEDEAEDPASEMAAGINSIFDTINGAIDNFQDMSEAAAGAQDTLDAATEAYNNQYQWGELAPSLTSGQCGMLGTCSECRMSERKKGPLMRDYRCKDRTAYQYGKVCNDEQLSSVNLCQTEDASLCHISYQVSDWRKAGSEFAACRTVPFTHMVNLSILTLFLRITKVVFVAMAARSTIMKRDALGLGPRVSLNGSTPRQCSVAFLRMIDL